jgi:tetratricopeptide (TPR) repeat protein
MIRRRVCAVAVGIVVVAAPHAARAGVDEAYAAYKAGRYLEAASELQAVVDRSPGYGWGFYLLGHCMLKMRSAGVAEGNFRRAIELQPERAEYYHGLALALKDQGDWPRAVQAASEGLARTQDARVRYALLSLRGYAWCAIQRWQPAIADLEVARRIHQEAWVFALLGKAYFALGQVRQAIPPLLVAEQAVPDDPTVLRVLGESYVRAAGDEPELEKKRVLYNQALGFAQRLTALVPNDLQAVHLVGRAALGAGRLEQAETLFLHVLSRDSRQCNAMVNLGRTYFAAERYPEAEASLVRAAACAPRMAVVYESLGDVYLKRGMAQRAADAFRRAAELAPAEDGYGEGGGRQPTPGTTSVSIPR